LYVINDINRGNNGMSWKNCISGCFGFVDKEFALHNTSCSNASKLLAAANAEGVGFQGYCQEIENWLKSQNCSVQHIAEQMANVKDLTYYLEGD
jgi:hypothetical protein